MSYSYTNYERSAISSRSRHSSSSCDQCETLLQEVRACRLDIESAKIEMEVMRESTAAEFERALQSEIKKTSRTADLVSSLQSAADIDKNGTEARFISVDDDITNEAKSRRRDIKAVKSSIEAVEQELAHAQAQTHTLETQVKEATVWRTRYGALDPTIKALKAQLETETQERQKLAVILSNNAVEMDVRHCEWDEQRVAIKALTARLDVTAHSVDKLTRFITKTDERIDHVNETLGTELDELRQKAEQNMDRREEFFKTSDVLMATMKTMAAESAKKKEDCLTVSNSVNELREELLHTKAENINRMADSEAKFLRLSHKRAEEQQATEALVEDLKKKVEIVNATAAEGTRSIEIAQATFNHANLAGKLNSLQAELNKMKSGAEERDKHLLVVTKANEELRARLLESAEDRKALLAIIEAYKAKELEASSTPGQWSHLEPSKNGAASLASIENGAAAKPRGQHKSPPQVVPKLREILAKTRISGPADDAPPTQLNDEPQLLDEERSESEDWASDMEDLIEDEKEGFDMLSPTTTRLVFISPTSA